MIVVLIYDSGILVATKLVKISIIFCRHLNLVIVVISKRMSKQVLDDSLPVGIRVTLEDCVMNIEI